MNDRQRGRAWRAGDYLGLVSDKPKPKIGSRSWWLRTAVMSAAVSVSLAIIFATR
ncbi:MAG: hypothetical protein ABI912_06295 [Actinomycetota bacterium]